MTKKEKTHAVITGWLIIAITSFYWAMYFMGHIDSNTMLYEHGPTMSAMFLLGVATVAGWHIHRWVK